MGDIDVGVYKPPTTRSWRLYAIERSGADARTILLLTSKTTVGQIRKKLAGDFGITTDRVVIKLRNNVLIDESKTAKELGLDQKGIELDFWIVNKT